MATYQDIKGLRVKYLSADPSTLVGGDVWYNSTSGTVKGVVSIEAWSSAPVLPEEQGYAMGAGISQNAAIIFSGAHPPGSTDSNRCYEYNGSGWSTGGDLTTARNSGGSSKNAPATNCLMFGGHDGTSDTGKTELYNGTAWSEEGDMDSGRREIGGLGTATGALAAGGTGSNTASEEYNGTSWTATNVINTGRGGLGDCGFGILTAGIIAGGEPAMTNVEEFNGTSWTAQTVLNTGGQNIGGVGTTSDGREVGGATPGALLATNQAYNGTSWTEGPDLATARQSMGIGGTASATIIGGGRNPANTAESEEFNRSVNTVTSAAWASAPALNTARSYVAGTGTQTAALAVAGYAGGISNNVEEYNGTSWAEQANLGTSRYSLSRGIGTQTAGLFAGGEEIPGGTSAASEEYNGTGWSATNSLTGGLSYLAGFGNADAALVVGGATPRSSAVNTNESFDGTNWTANPATPFTVKEGATSGPATAGVFAGGNPGVAASYEINSTTWTTGNSMNTGRKASGFGGGAATQTAGWIAGGEEPDATTATEHYDGTTWSTSASIGTARAKSGGAGAQATGLIFGGGPDSGLTAAEEFTAETSVAAASTLTTS